jgi:DNA anti-recombination protein RmuC
VARGGPPRATPALKEAVAMKKTLIALAVLLVLGVAVGFWQGWFKFEKTQTDEGKPAFQVSVDKDKFKQDKERLKKAASAKSQAWKERLAHLRNKVKGQSGEEKTKTEKEIEDLDKKHQTLESKLKDIDDAAEDKLENVQKDVNTLLEDPNKEGEKEADKPK